MGKSEMTPGQEERLRVLELVSQGKISAEEGARLIEALERVETTPPPTAKPPTLQPASPRWLRVCITNLHSGRTLVNMRLPVSVLEAGLRLGARLGPSLTADQQAHILRAVRAGYSGLILDVRDEEAGERVEILLE
ncbi:SHOCT-like domain-containing protein, partial [Thermanaerothrix sp.]|uniref:SHOCT-like domain-containing protein n=1 Tax=Thermanaerothrix sp. TaxID=2972675 RepID=UPI003C7E1B1B